MLENRLHDTGVGIESIAALMMFGAFTRSYPPPSEWSGHSDRYTVHYYNRVGNPMRVAELAYSDT